MLHRHLNHEGYTLAVIDDIIARGKRRDWTELRSVALRDRAVMEKILRVAQAYAQDKYAQRHAFWRPEFQPDYGRITMPPRTLTAGFTRPLAQV